MDVIWISTAVAGALGIVVWFALLVWAAREDGRAQRREEARDPRPRPGTDKVG